MKLSKKKIKKLKKLIQQESALSIGYASGIIKAIPDYAIIEAIETMIDLHVVKKHEVENIFITECIRVMSYSDFKDIVKYFYVSEDEIG